MTVAAPICMAERQDPPEQRGLHRRLGKSVVADDDVDDDVVLPVQVADAFGGAHELQRQILSDCGGENHFVGECESDAARGDSRKEDAPPQASAEDDGHQPLGHHADSRCSSSSSHLSGLRRALQDDFDLQLHRSGHDVNEDDDDDDYTCSSEGDSYPHGRIDDDDDDRRCQYQYGDGGFESMLELEEMEQSLNYNDYMEREIDAYLEEPMRQLMRDMEREMELSYIDEFSDEDDYDEIESLSRRDQAEPITSVVPSRQRNNRELRREGSAVSSTSSYASVQASIQHAISNYHNWVLASSRV